MRLFVGPDYDAMSVAAVERISRLVRSKPDAAIMVATGSTPLGTYSRLAEISRAGELNLSAVQFFQLDAYLGESDSGDDPSFASWLQRALLEPAGLGGERLLRLRADAMNQVPAGAEFEDAIASAGGLDLAILGLGVNAHVGFNEPPARSDSRTRVVTLLPETVASNHRYWGVGKPVPRQGITAGIATIMAARELMMLVSGTGKAAALSRTLEGEISDEVPASHLRGHAGLTVFADEAAASLLSSRG